MEIWTETNFEKNLKKIRKWNQLPFWFHIYLIITRVNVAASIYLTNIVFTTKPKKWRKFLLCQHTKLQKNFYRSCVLAEAPGSLRWVMNDTTPIFFEWKIFDTTHTTPFVFERKTFDTTHTTAAVARGLFYLYLLFLLLKIVDYVSIYW